jgi:hypothetical protein
MIAKLPKTIPLLNEIKSLWLTQKLMGQLFDVPVPTLNEHLKNIISSGELEKQVY